jgi:hypothetical protein
MNLPRIGAFALLSALAFTACGNKAPVGNASDPSASASNSGSVSADAEISLVYQPTEAYAEIESFVQEREVFEDIVEALNKELVLPEEIVVNVGGDPDGPYFDPATRMIEYPYEFMALVVSLFEDDYEEEELRATVAGSLRFVLVHELGHALIETLEIPVLGREEDAVDGLAAIVLMDVLPQHGSTADQGGYDTLSGAELFFDFSGSDTNGQSKPRVNVELAAFADEHSMDLQRFYSIACLTAGSSQTNYDIIEAAGFVPESRLVRCPGEYEQASTSWGRLLTPYFQEN